MEYNHPSEIVKDVNFGDIAKNKTFNRNNNQSRYSSDKADNNKIQVLYFNYKTYMNEVYKLKET